MAENQSSSNSSAKVQQNCGNKHCIKPGKHLCSGCGEEIYCSKECQKTHWATHKPLCMMAVKPEAAAFLKSLDSMSVKQLKNIMRAKAASFEAKKRSIVIAKLDKIIEKPSLVKFVQEYVSPSEVESLLSAPSSAVPSSSSSSSANKKAGGSNRSGGTTSSGSLNGNPNPHASRFSNSSQATPSPDQLRQQASMMRKHPNMVRKANPAFAKMTDTQIREYADQLEQAANNPEMMKEVERMSRLSDGEKSQLQRIQEGFSGAVPMDDKWIGDTVNSLKQNPNMFKVMIQGKGAALGGASDDQIGGFIDMASRMDAWVLKLIIKIFIFLGSLYQPLVAAYTAVDNFTFGGGRYIALGVFAIIAYYCSSLTWMVLKLCARQAMALYSIVLSMIYGASGDASAATAADPSFAASTLSGAVSSASDKVAESVAGLSADGGIAAATAAASAAMGMSGDASGRENKAQRINKAESADAEFEF